MRYDFAPALGQTLVMLLAALGAPCQQNGDEWPRRGGQQPVHPQTGRKPATQDLSPRFGRLSHMRVL